MSRLDIEDSKMNPIQVYRVSRGWRIFLTALMVPLIGIFGWLMVMPFLDGKSSQTGSVVLYDLLWGSFILFSLYALLSAFKSKIEIFPDRIRDVGLFRTKELLISEISGFRLLPTQYAPTLLLVPNNSETRKIKTSLIIEHRDDLLDWLNRNLTDLDAVDYQDEMDKVLQDTRLGETEDERLWLLARARRWAMILNGLGIIVVLWALIKPQPYPYVIWTLILLPLITLGFVNHFKGALKLDGKAQDALPNIIPAFLMPCLGLAFRAFNDFNILDWDKFWLPFGLASIALYFIAAPVAKNIKKKSDMAILLIFFCGLFGYAAVICLNGILDKSPVAIYKTTVLEKRISRGKHTSYYLKLSPWGPKKEEEEVDVGKSVYNRRETGDHAVIVVTNGRFGIPCFYVR